MYAHAVYAFIYSSMDCTYAYFVSKIVPYSLAWPKECTCPHFALLVVLHHWDIESWLPTFLLCTSSRWRAMHRMLNPVTPDKNPVLDKTQWKPSSRKVRLQYWSTGLTKSKTQLGLASYSNTSSWRGRTENFHNDRFIERRRHASPSPSLSTSGSAGQ